MNQGMTKSTKLSDIKRAWHMIDVEGKILGRLSTDIAKILMGKSKPYYVANLDCGDYAVVINAEKIVTTGKKEMQKKYSRHSGFPGGYKEEALIDLRKRNPTEIIKYAVSGMLPQNKLRDRMLLRLFVFAGKEHPYADKFKSKD